MTFTPIASSSAGNAYLVTDGDTRILLECGIPYKRLQAALDYAVPDFDGCLITHEHKDHAGHIDQLLKRGVPVYASPGTARMLELDAIRPFEMPKGSNIGPPFMVGSVTVVPFRTFHDAVQPVGFLIRGKDGEQLVFATDTCGINYRFPDVTILAIEANYDDLILSRNTRMPESVVLRVRNSHMEISKLADYLKSLDLSACREIWLLHLSDASSNEVEFTYKVRQSVGKSIAIYVAGK
ncbi:MAG: MBL fold metallo-hydrolase [Oscillospiraceae bacterium]|nr:MBL fold metallo-hydrolase [Oscillospiraceae bacterium]